MKLSDLMAPLIIELSEGNNLGNNDGFLMILVGSITLPKVIRNWAVT